MARMAWQLDEMAMVVVLLFDQLAATLMISVMAMAMLMETVMKMMEMVMVILQLFEQQLIVVVRGGFEVAVEVELEAVTELVLGLERQHVVELGL